MRNFTVKGSDNRCEYDYDCKRIQRVLNERGFNCDHNQAHELWLAYSDSMAAGWMHLPEDDGLLYLLCETYMDYELD